ncbi:MAG: hypothetical protein LBK57_10530 [Clostridiales Family XIII bacterium]|jgi:hypothetical protein|nr:hypothetical protein [Clostridiales Family XIII bacterium]
MLKPNEAYVSRFAIDEYADGSASFDANDLPGNAGAPNKTSGAVNGRIFGYALQLQMVNVNGTVKHLKGVELPQGEINFDIKLEVTKSVNSGAYNDITGTGPGQIMPLLWDFKPNSRAANGNGGRNMAFAGVSSYIGGGIGAPLNSGGPDTIRTLCVNGGTWTMTQTGDTISVSVDAYEFIKNNIYEWPLRNEGATAGSAIYYGEDRGIGVFSAGFMQVVFPIPDSVDASTAFRLEVSDTNLRTRTLSESSAAAKTQPVTNDDSSTVQVELVPRGSYDKYSYLSKENETGSPYWADSNLSSMNAMGPDAWAPYGSNISIFGAAVTGAERFLKSDVQAVVRRQGGRHERNARRAHAHAGPQHCSG